MFVEDSANSYWLTYPELRRKYQFVEVAIFSGFACLVNNVLFIFGLCCQENTNNLEEFHAMKHNPMLPISSFEQSLRICSQSLQTCSTRVIFLFVVDIFTLPSILCHVVSYIVCQILASNNVAYTFP